MLHEIYACMLGESQEQDYDELLALHGSHFAVPNGSTNIFSVASTHS